MRILGPAAKLLPNRAIGLQHEFVKHREIVAMQAIVRTGRIAYALAVICLLMRGTGPSYALTLGSEAPGNIFVAGAPLRFTVREPSGHVSITLRDYFGRIVAQSQAGNNGAVELPPVPPGWYELTVRDRAGEQTVSLGVVRDRHDAPLPSEGKICADAASAWLVHDEAQRRPFARMVKLAGIPWVRERMSWTANEPSPGRFAWQANYENTVAAFKTEGIHVYEIWHDSPPWTRPGKTASLAPDDLRTVYRFARAAAAHFAPTVAAWEVWNEPDISFWPDLSDRFAGLQKAAYWGLKDGNPAAWVLNGSFAWPAGPFGQGVYGAGVGQYSDILNWHRYADPQVYPGDLAAHQKLLRRAGASSRPAWMTEAGISLTGREGPGNRLLNAEDQRKQAQFIPRSAVLSLAAGNAKHFFFVLPDYVENGVQFGALKPDLTPYPSFVALSAAANILGLAEYRGRFPTPDGVQAYLFHTPHGNVLVAWSDRPAHLTIPTEKKTLSVANIFGAVTQSVAADGRVTLDVGPEAVYALDVGTRAERRLTRSTTLIVERPETARKPSRIVLMGHAALPENKEQDTYRLDETGPRLRPFVYTVEAYNFDAKKRQSGVVTLALPQGWKTAAPHQAVSLPPMGRAVLTFPLIPASAGETSVDVVASGRFPGEVVAPSRSRFAIDPAALTPIRRQALDWADAAKWVANNVSAGGQATLTVPTPGTVRIASTFTGANDRWAYPILRLPPGTHLSGWDGIAFDLKTEAATPNSWVRMQLQEDGGSSYVSSAVIAPDGPRRVVLLFRDMQWGSFSPPDPDSRLDLNHVSTVLLGLNTPGATMAFEASHFELVKFGPAGWVQRQH